MLSQMGFFENLGRKVEEFKQTATETAAEEASYSCRSCGERFYTDHDDCPECGGAVVQRTDESAAVDDPDGELSNGHDDTESTDTDAQESENLDDNQTNSTDGRATSDES